MRRGVRALAASVMVEKHLLLPIVCNKFHWEPRPSNPAEELIVRHFIRYCRYELKLCGWRRAELFFRNSRLSNY